MSKNYLMKITNKGLSAKERAEKAVKKYLEAEAELEALEKAYSDKGITVEKLKEVIQKSVALKKAHYDECVLAFTGKVLDTSELSLEFNFITD